MLPPGTHQDAYIAPKSLYRNRGTRRLFSRLLYKAGGRYRVREGEDATRGHQSGGTRQPRQCDKTSAGNVRT